MMRRLSTALRWLAFRGRDRQCPLCGRGARRFLPAGRTGDRPDALCPWCRSLERHRLVWLYLERETDLLRRPGRVLHLAPEQALTRALDRFPAVETVTCDLRADDVDVAADLTSLGFADGSFDWVYCSHVLEHVADDRAAMAELRRVVRPGGTVIVQVPVRDGATYEDPAVTSPADRLAAFGQEDHVRHYGLDVTTRLEDAGFRVGTIRADRLFSRDEIHRHGLIPDDLLFRCDRHD